jgi:hypothetical protein
MMSYVSEFTSGKKWRQVLVSRPWKSLPEIKIDNAQDLSSNSIAKCASTGQACTIRLPPPSKVFKRGGAARCRALKSEAKVSAIELSNASPQRIISISSDLANKFGFKSAELCGRSMSVFQGPNTDTISLRASLKAAAARTSTSLKLILYSSDGAGHEIVVQCQPTMDTRGEVSGCALRITFPRSSDEASGVVDVAELSAIAECRRLPGEKELRRRCLSEHRFRTGLAIQEALKRREALGSRAGWSRGACA